MTREEFRELKIGDLVKNIHGTIYKILKCYSGGYQAINFKNLGKCGVYTPSYWSKLTDLDKVKLL